MTVCDSDVVDAIGTGVDTGVVTLAVFDHLPWDDCDEHLVALQAKINTYLQFVESSETLAAFPAAASREVEIEVHFKHRPVRYVQQFLEVAKAVVTDAGVNFSWESCD